MDGWWQGEAAGGDAAGLAGRVVRGTVVAYHADAHTADVRPAAASGTLWPQVPVVQHCSGALLPAGRDVAMVVWPDASALVLGPHGGRAAYPLSDNVDDWGNVTFDATDYTPYAGLEATLDTPERCYFWIALMVVAHLEQVRVNAWAARVYINGQQGALPMNPGQYVANSYVMQTLVYRTGAYAAGHYTFRPRFRVITAGDVLHVRTINLAVVALPAP